MTNVQVIYPCLILLATMPTYLTTTYLLSLLIPASFSLSQYRTLQTSLPQDVAVGAFEIANQRLLYTYFNSTTLSGGLALVGGSFLLFVIFLYFYDLAENGNKRSDENGESINDVSFDYSDPYGYYDPTTRIKR